MNKQAQPVKQAQSVFLENAVISDRHIVDTLIAERCPTFASHFTWPVVRPILYKLLGYRKAREMADTLDALSGLESFGYMSRRLNLSLSINRLDRVPASGRLVVAVNHPTGLADGIAVWDGLREVREDIVFLANADAVRVNPRFQDVIIPVEWVEGKRSPAKTRETLKRAAAAFEQEKCVVIFPSGKLAWKVDGVLTEKTWFPTVVSLARKYEAPLLPLNLHATNSALFYFLSRLNGELRDITLFHELLNKHGDKFELTFGKLISGDQLTGDSAEIAEALRHFVSQTLGKNEDADFTPEKKCG